MSQDFSAPIGPFTGEFRFLSNFCPAAVTFEGLCYPTAEHAFQAAKSGDRTVRERIRQLPTASAAKRAGRNIPLRPDWEQVKRTVIQHILREKFHHFNLRALLISTHPRRLMEVNQWGDRFWGVYEGTGANHLGLMLMALRCELRSTSQR